MTQIESDAQVVERLTPQAELVYPIGQIPAWACVLTADGRFETTPLPMGPRVFMAGSLDGFLALCSWLREKFQEESCPARSLIQVDETALAATIHRQDSGIEDMVLMRVPFTAAWTWLREHVEPEPLTQRELLTVFRGDLAGCVPDGLKVAFQQVCFSGSKTADMEATRGRESIASSVKREVAFRHGEPPDRVPVSVGWSPLIRLAETDVFVDLTVEVDIENEMFIVNADGDRMTEVLEAWKSALRDWLQGSLGNARFQVVVAANPRLAEEILKDSRCE